jgi:hypothetical protein
MANQQYKTMTCFPYPRPPVLQEDSMSDTVSSTELDGQHVELLPARTVLSMFSAGNDGGIGENGADAVGKLGINVLGIPLIPGGGNAVGSAGGNADG